MDPALVALALQRTATRPFSTPPATSIPSVLDFYDQGVDWSGQNDSTAGLQYALDHVVGDLDWGPAGGKYKFSQLVQNTMIRHRGRGAPRAEHTQWLIQDSAPDAIAFLIQADEGAHATYAIGSAIHGISMSALNHSGTYGSATGRGLVVRAPYFTMADCDIGFMGGTGLEIDSTTGRDGADEWSLFNVEVGECGGHGFFVHGFDSNLGLALGCRSHYNHQTGIVDESLNNCWLSCYTSANDGQGWDLGPASYATLINCGAEDTVRGNFGVAVVLGGNIQYNPSTSRPLLVRSCAVSEPWGIDYFTKDPSSTNERDFMFVLQQAASMRSPLRWTGAQHPSGEGHAAFPNPIHNTNYIWSLRQDVVFGPGITVFEILLSNFMLQSNPQTIDDKLDLSASVEFADADLDHALVSFLGWSRRDTTTRGLMFLRTKWRNDGDTVNGTLVIRAKHYSDSYG